MSAARDEPGSQTGPGDRVAPDTERGMATTLAEANAEIAVLATTLAKTGRRFARERRAIAATDASLRDGANLALQHFVTVEVDMVSRRLNRVVQTLGVDRRRP